MLLMEVIIAITKIYQAFLLCQALCKARISRNCQKRFRCSYVGLFADEETDQRNIFPENFPTDIFACSPLALLAQEDTMHKH